MKLRDTVIKKMLRRDHLKELVESYNRVLCSLMLQRHLTRRLVEYYIDRTMGL